MKKMNLLKRSNMAREADNNDLETGELDVNGVSNYLYATIAK